MPLRTEWDNAGNTLKQLSNIFTSTLHYISRLHSQMYIKEKQNQVKPFHTLPQQRPVALLFLQSCSNFELCKPVYSLHKTCFSYISRVFKKFFIFLLQQQCTVEVNVTFLQYNGCSLSQPEVVIVKTADKIFRMSHFNTPQ